MNVTVRFAPSPTGGIHIGNVRAALINYLFARQQGGRFILRFDDTDQKRSKNEYALCIAGELCWLGIEPDNVVWQSGRFTLYDTAADLLRTRGLLYPCYETEDELESKRRYQCACGLPPVYDRAALRLSAEERGQMEAEGRRPHWRFMLSGEKVGWHDLVRGDQVIDTRSLSDPILIREDGGYLYTLPSVVDDIDLGITHVIRGEDHVTNTGVQVELFKALGASVLNFAHYSLLTDIEGEKLSKRSCSLSVAELRDEGIEPMALVSIAALIGTSEKIALHTHIDSLIDVFTFSKLSRSPARFDKRSLIALNVQFLRQLDFADVASRLQAMNLSINEAMWMTIRSNLNGLYDVKQWEQIMIGMIDPIIEDRDFLMQAATLLSGISWDENIWQTWMDTLKKTTGRKGSDLFHPLRLALTAREDGPDLLSILSFIGREKAIARLSGQRA